MSGESKREPKIDRSMGAYLRCRLMEACVSHQGIQPLLSWIEQTEREPGPVILRSAFKAQAEALPASELPERLIRVFDGIVDYEEGKRRMVNAALNRRDRRFRDFCA